TEPARHHLPPLFPYTTLFRSLMLLAASVLEGFADHAIGTEIQIAWQAQLLKVEEALARGDLAAAERQWREAYAAALKSRHWQGRSEEHTSELQSPYDPVCRLL